ncbi:hypothetical protein LXJ15735_25160 [Lacrimispora xylanolytica]
MKYEIRNMDIESTIDKISSEMKTELKQGRSKERQEEDEKDRNLRKRRNWKIHHSFKYIGCNG